MLKEIEETYEKPVLLGWRFVVVLKAIVKEKSLPLGFLL